MDGPGAMYEGIGMQGMFGPNPYTSYPGAMPMPGYADEAPTDALGRTGSGYNAYLTSHPGTTLNSPPPTAASSYSDNPQMDQIAGWQALTSPEMAARGNTYGDPYLNLITQGKGGTGNGGQGGPNAMTNAVLQGAYGGRFGLAPTGDGGGGSTGGGGGGPDHNAAYLYSLSHPDPMPTYGATVPQAQPIGQNQPSVLQSFLASHPSGGTGAGNYNNAGFFNTLAGTGGAK